MAAKKTTSKKPVTKRAAPKKAPAKKTTAKRPRKKSVDPIVVHHLEYSQSMRILWLMEELGAPYELKIYKRDPKTKLAPDDYKALSPLGTSPVITQGDVTLAESNAIIDFILDQYGKDRLRPKAGSPERADYLFWFHASQGSFMPLLLIDVLHTILRQRVPGLIRPLINGVLNKADDAMLKPRMTRLIKKAESDLERNHWLAGKTITAADIVMSYCMEAAESRGYITNAHPNCKRWLSQMNASASFRAALAKDGTGSAIFKL